MTFLHVRTTFLLFFIEGDNQCFLACPSSNTSLLFPPRRKCADLGIRDCSFITWGMKGLLSGTFDEKNCFEHSHKKGRFLQIRLRKSEFSVFANSPNALSCNGRKEKTTGKKEILRRFDVFLFRKQDFLYFSFSEGSHPLLTLL